MLCGLVKSTPEIDNKLELFYKLHISCKINLTAIKERNEFYLKHYLDSVYYFENNLKPSGKLADVGSGGGFPGIVLAIFYPELKITLIESIRKKCDFLEEASKELDLKNVTVENDRVENIKNQSYDIITARGVAPVKAILKNTFGISKPGTKWILYKGEKIFEEIDEASKLIAKKGVHIETVRVETPFKRTYCIISY